MTPDETHSKAVGAHARPDLAAPQIPSQLRRLPELAHNLWWSWRMRARTLFRNLDPELWRALRHNPVRLLAETTQERLDRAAADPTFLRLYDSVLEQFDAAMNGGRAWFRDRYPGMPPHSIAFFSAEYGVHSSLPLYAGGLGVLAGDIAKEASDLFIPIVGVGFMYPQGYFRQRLSVDGRQEEQYEIIDRTKVPVRPVLGPDGEPLMIELPLPDRMLRVATWRVDVGRVPLYLMDTDIEGNAPWDRELTGRLYGGDQNVRFLQELVLGVGGVRVLRALGLAPFVWHGNEGHTALMMAERLREFLTQGQGFEEAVENVRGTTIFTTHTPVPAGHDAFPFSLVEGYLNRLDGFGDPDARRRLLEIAHHPEPWGPAFHMTVLALRLSAQVNGVSRRHGEVSRKMWRGLWPDRSEDQVPIESITNGVHVASWISGEMNWVHRRYLDENWLEHQDDPLLWKRLDKVPDEVLWDSRKRLKRKLFHFLRDRIRERWSHDRVDASQTVALGSLLDTETFTIGFARRFATYKRATLILSDTARLRAILCDLRRPVQLIFAGKAHPADETGKTLLQTIYNAARDPAIAGRIAVLEDYDMHAAHYLVQGVDLWLNNPRAPNEASGTSGIKAALSGVPNLSVLDGWWPEAYDGTNGWAIDPPSDPATDDHEKQTAQDAADADAIYRILEEVIVPCYYDRDDDAIPHGWLLYVRRTMQTVTHAFSARRMMKEYAERFYANAAAHRGLTALTQDVPAQAARR